MGKLRAVCLLVCLGVVPAAFAADAEVTLTIEQSRLVATGIKARGEVLFYGRSIGRRNGMPLLEQFRAMVRDEDGDGVVVWTPAKLLPRSVWVAIDFENGAYAVAAPSGFPIVLMNLANDVWRGGKSYVDISRDRVEFLWLRPKATVWSAMLYQGGSDDADGRNDAYLRADLSRLQPIYGDLRSAPPTANARDVLLAIHPTTLDLFVRAAE